LLALSSVPSSASSCSFGSSGHAALGLASARRPQWQRRYHHRGNTIMRSLAAVARHVDTAIAIIITATAPPLLVRHEGQPRGH
jgi:hypothetical protein